MQLRFSMFFLVLLCAIAVLGLIGWAEGWALATGLARFVLPCFAVLAVLQWIWIGSSRREDNDDDAIARTDSQNGRNEPQLDPQPVPESVSELSGDSSGLPSTVAVAMSDSELSTLANNSPVTMLDLKHELTGHVQAIRSMGNSINQRAQDPAFTQASALIVESADRIDTVIGDVLSRNDAGALEADLSDSLRGYIEQCKQRAVQMRFTLRLAPNIDSVSAPVAKAIDLIVRGAVENAIAHSGASHIESNLRRVNDELEVQVVDNGVGLPGAGLSKSAGGMQTMRDRAQALGGSFDVGKSRLGGVAVKARIPALGVIEPKVANG